MQRSLGLIKPDKPMVARRAAFVVLIGWVPLAVLAAVQGLLLRDGAAMSFFTDFAAYARFLVAAPLFILAERDCIPRLGRIAQHFLDAGFVAEPDHARFDDAVQSTRRQLDSTSAEFTTLLLAYGVALALAHYVPSDLFPAWHRPGGGRVPTFSLAGWWHVLVSVPLLLVLFFGWMWRVLLWGWFLWQMARLDLRLIPGHPDHAGGLQFVSTSLRGFRLLTFGLGAVVAGGVANRVVHAGASPLEFKNLAVGLVGFVLALFAGPLVVFMRQLRGAKRQGTFEYGALAGDLGRQFEHKWLRPAGGVDGGALDVQDFSATTDLFSIVANVYEMKDLPFGLRNLGFLAAGALLPFVPVALLVIPLKEVIKGLAKLLL